MVEAARERTFIMIKPDGVQRGLVGEIISRFEKKGFKLVAMKLVHATKELLEQHYADLCDIEFTIERGKLWMLQTRVGKRTAGAAFRIATQLVDEGVIDHGLSIG